MASFFVSKYGVHSVINRKKILKGILHQVTAVIEVTSHGAFTVWELISSCYGKGFWINEQPWDSDSGWVN